MSDVREQLRTYFDEVDPPFDPSDLMNDPRTVPVSRPGVSRGVLIAAVAAMVLVLAVGLPLLFLANRLPMEIEPSATATQTVPTESPADVFSWSEDDINDWVTNDEMAAVLADLSIEYADTRLDGQVEFDPVANIDDIGVVWTIGPADGDNHWQVSVHNGDHNSDELWLYESELTLPQGEITTGGWGVFTARGPNSDESFCISLQPPVEIFGALVQEDIYEEMISVVASMMLEELGWVG